MEELHAKISEKQNLLPEEPSCSNGSVLSNDDKQDSPDSSDSSLSACSSSDLPLELWSKSLLMITSFKIKIKWLF